MQITLTQSQFDLLRKREAAVVQAKMAAQAAQHSAGMNEQCYQDLISLLAPEIKQGGSYKIEMRHEQDGSYSLDVIEQPAAGRVLPLTSAAAG